MENQENRENQILSARKQAKSQRQWKIKINKNYRTISSAFLDPLLFSFVCKQKIVGLAII